MTHTTLVGESDASRTLREDITFAARADAKVLITGDTGVGKDLVAHLIHQSSARRLAPMASINCAGLPDSLLESELFGHVRGSFTDAHRDKAGILESAANGTVFLDEVGEMSARMQAVLLRFLETGELQRVGADRVHARVNVRVIAATNRDLLAEMQAGRFREDLYYRLNVMRIHVPPLRERRDDIAPLLRHYLQRYSAQYHMPTRTLTPEALSRLVANDWPGNVRQLKNVVERMVVKAVAPVIDVAELPHDVLAIPVARAASPTGHTTSLGAPAGALAPAAAAPAATTVDDLAARLLEGGESFWSAVHAPFMDRDLTRAQLTDLVARGLERTAGNYRSLVLRFNMPASDYKRFMAFLSKHRCHVPYRQFRFAASAPATRRPVTPIASAADRGHARAVGL